MAKLTVLLVEAKLRELGGNIAAVARAFEVSRRAVQNFNQAHPKLQEVLKEARETMIDDAESSLYKAIKNGEAWAVCFFLKTQGKCRGYIESGEEALRKEFEKAKEELAQLKQEIQDRGKPAP